VARWLPGYPEWLQFCWDFAKPSKNYEIALQHFFFFVLAAVQEFFPISFVLHAIFSLPTTWKRLQNFFFQNHPQFPSPQVRRIVGSGDENARPRGPRGTCQIWRDSSHVTRQK